MRRILFTSVFMALLITQAYAINPDHQVDVALVDLNSSFIKAHAAARKLNLENNRPIILLRGRQLVLVHNNTEITSNIIFQGYDTFKVFSHIPVAIYLMLGPPGSGKLDFERFQQLRQYLKKMEHVEQNIDQIGLKGTDLERQKIILVLSKQYLKTVIGRQEYSTKDLYSFMRRMLPMIKANISGAAKSQIDAIHHQIMAWKRKIAPNDWKNLRVATQGAVLARNGDLVKQYFKHLLHIETEGMRLAYMELYFPPTPMLTLLATRAVDRGISLAVFDNPDRLFRDVLSDAATTYIKKLNFD